MELTCPQILEVTLRDGSYVIDFKFTASDTAFLCQELERAGFTMIEIGHGVGLGAYRQPRWRAPESDEGHMRAASQTLKSARWGMFCIPGIARLEDVDLAAQYGMHFIRVGTNVTEVEASRPFIERARNHGMQVCANFMKSYAMDARSFGRQAKLSHSYGADVLYVVDSAGGMLTAEMERYFDAVRENCDIAIGFHGHDNLRLSVPNSLRAVELGATLIDTSLQGLGRSAGNTPTEVFLAVLERSGRATGFDLLQVMDLGERHIKPLLVDKGLQSLDIVTGLAQFHSSYMDVIVEFSGRHGLDPRLLIREVSDADKIDAPRELVERVALRLVQSGQVAPPQGVFASQFHLHQYVGGEQSFSGSLP